MRNQDFEPYNIEPLVKRDRAEKALLLKYEKVLATDQFTADEAIDVGCAILVYTNEFCFHEAMNPLASRVQRNTRSYWERHLVSAQQGDYRGVRQAIRAIAAGSEERAFYDRRTQNQLPEAVQIELGERLRDIANEIPMQGIPFQFNGPAYLDEDVISAPDPVFT